MKISRRGLFALIPGAALAQHIPIPTPIPNDLLLRYIEPAVAVMTPKIERELLATFLGITPV